MANKGLLDPHEGHGFSGKKLAVKDPGVSL